MPISDDVTLDAALYGSAHVPTILHHDDSSRIMDVLENRISEILDRTDLELASNIMDSVPELVYSDDDLDPADLPGDIIQTVYGLRGLIRNHMALKLITSWDDSIDDRGRLIGMGEHSVRRSSTGQTDEDYKMAILKNKGGGR